MKPIKEELYWLNGRPQTVKVGVAELHLDPPGASRTIYLTDHETGKVTELEVRTINKE